MHTAKDKKVSIGEAEEIQRILNGHMRWLAAALNLGSHWDQQDRCLQNLLNHGLSIYPMTLTIKDHKVWSLESGIPPPSRPLMDDSKGMNTMISEVLSIILEPIA